MTDSIKSTILGSIVFFALSMCLTSCEGTLDDIFGEWDKPSGNTSSGESTPSSDDTPVVFASNEYNDGSWNATDKKVDFTKKTAPSDPTEIANDYTGTISSGWYTVTGDNVTLGTTGTPVTVTLTGDTYLILCDGAKLTINGKITGADTYNLHIYGQHEGTGEFNIITPPSDG